jgi:RimJ/RimL family protein N-acetyltransferase
MMRYGFAEMGLHRIELAVFAYNTRAQALYRSLGFTEEGRRREVVLHDGIFHDEIVMSILEDEWRTGLTG